MFLVSKTSLCDLFFQAVLEAELCCLFRALGSIHRTPWCSSVGRSVRWTEKTPLPPSCSAVLRPTTVRSVKDSIILFLSHMDSDFTDEKKNLGRNKRQLCQTSAGSASTLVCSCMCLLSGTQQQVSCEVKVVNLQNAANISNGFTYKSELTPVISEVSPRRGGTAGGTRLTITGSSFRWGTVLQILLIK